MNIYFIRHGEAEDSSFTKLDFDRELTNEGRIKLERAAQNWKNLVPHFDQIISSPLTRALQTAEIIVQVYNYSKKLIVDKKLGLGSDTLDIIEIANSLKAMNIAFVGHEPDFSRHVSSLISNSGANINYKKGMIAKISFHGKVRIGSGQLEFLIPTKAYK